MAYTIIEKQIIIDKALDNDITPLAAPAAREFTPVMPPAMPTKQQVDAYPGDDVIPF